MCLLAGLLLAATRGESHGHELRQAAPARLSDLVRDAQRAVAAAAAQRDGLALARDQAAGAVAASDSGVAAAVQALEGLQVPGGLTPRTGPGLRVTLTDAPRDADGNYPAGAAPDDLVVHQQDLEGVLNALWAGGAEAVAVMDQRITATSVPRCIGNTLLLHGQAYSPPYTVAAIGDAEKMRTALDAEPAVRLYRQYAARYNLGYDVVGGDVDIPAYTGPLRVWHTQLLDPADLPAG